MFGWHILRFVWIAFSWCVFFCNKKVTTCRSEDSGWIYLLIGNLISQAKFILGQITRTHSYSTYVRGRAMFYHWPQKAHAYSALLVKLALQVSWVVAILYHICIISGSGRVTSHSQCLLPTFLCGIEAVQRP